MLTRRLFVITVDFKKAGLKPGQKVIDIGCGSGRHVAAAYQHPSVTAIGTDPFATHAFDLVICSEVMEHIHDERAAAAELYRVLKPGHPMVISVPRFVPEWVCWRLSDEYHMANQGHIRIYRKKRLVAMFENIGLHLTGHHYAHSLHAPYWWLKCLVGPTREDSRPVNIYHRFLTWDIMQKPKLTRLLDNLFNPLFGKSLVLYFMK